MSIAKKIPPPPHQTSYRYAPDIETAGPAGAALFSSLVRDGGLHGMDAIHFIRAGYPAAVLKSAGAYFGVTDALIRRVADVADTTANRLEKNDAKLGAAATERILRMAHTSGMAEDVFEDAAAARRWMTTPNRSLAEMAPLELMDTEPGAQAVRQVLNAIATGGVA